MKKLHKKGGLNSLLTWLAVVGLFLSILPSNLYAAAPNTLTINGSECRAVLGTIASHVPPPQNGGRGSGVGTSPLQVKLDSLPDYIKDAINNLYLADDYRTLDEAADTVAGTPVVNFPIITFEAQVASTENSRNCTENPAFLISRPSEPSEFFGYIRGYDWIQIPTLDSTNRTIKLKTQNTVGQSETFNVGGSTDVSFVDRVETVGFCGADITGGSRQGYLSCMRATVQDFNTITYRGETYRLKSWQGDNSSPLQYVLDVASSPYDARKNALAGCKTKPFFQVDNDEEGGSLIDELTGDNDLRGLMDEMAERFGNNGTHPLAFRDVDLLCQQQAATNIDVGPLSGFNRVAQFFPKEKNIVIIMGQNTTSMGSSERKLLGTYTQSQSNPRQFTLAAGDCANQTNSFTFTADPSSFSDSTGWTTATWDFYDGCTRTGAEVYVRVTRSDSTETSTAVAGQTTDGGSNSAEEPIRTCSTEAGALGWILCPILTLLDEGAKAMEDLIGGFLFVEQSRFDRVDGQENGIYTAWSTMRGIATVIIVIVALVMIFSQSMGGGFLDNYSVKKILPRLLLAGIAIQLSWFLMTMLVNISNIFGDGIGGLLLSPFQVGGERLSPNTELGDIIGGLTDQSSIGDFAGGVTFVGLVVAAPFLAGGIVALAIGVMSALFVGFITLIVRDMIVVLGVVLAPVAIAMSVMPGTQKTSKWWWESFEKALMMYPFVMALLAAGKIIAFLLLASADPAGDGGIKITYLLGAIVAWYFPFLALPKALQAGGAALGKISGFAGDKSKGAFDRIRGWDTDRKKKVADIKKNVALSNGGIRGGWANFKSGNFGGIRGSTRAGTRYARNQARSGAMSNVSQITAEDDYRRRTDGRSLEIDKAMVKAGDISVEARNFNLRNELDKTRAKDRELASQNQARDDYRARTGESLDVHQAELKVQQVQANAQRFDVNAARAEMEAKEAKVAADQAAVSLANNMGADWNNADVVAAQFATATDANQQQAILNRLMTLGADQQMRDLIAGGGIPADMLTSTRQSGEWVGAFKDKAPDLVKGSGAFDTLPPAQKMHDWSNDTLKLALAHNGGANVSEIKRLAEEDPDFAASLDAKKRTALESVAGTISYAKKATG